jgi:hypothetical protein
VIDKWKTPNNDASQDTLLRSAAIDQSHFAPKTENIIGISVTIFDSIGKTSNQNQQRLSDEDSDQIAGVTFEQSIESTIVKVLLHSRIQIEDYQESESCNVHRITSQTHQ